MFSLSSKSLLLLSSLVSSILLLSLPLSSVSAASEFFTHAQTLSNQGVIIYQRSEDGYRLSNTISRAEATKLALSTAGVPQNNCQYLSSFSFSDVNASLGDLCGYIEGAVVYDVITPSNTNRTINTSTNTYTTSNNTPSFFPRTAITRADFADLIVRSFDVTAPSLINTPQTGAQYFTDVPVYTPTNQSSNTANQSSSTTYQVPTSSSNSEQTSSSINRLATTGCLNLNLLTFRPSDSISRGESFKIMACILNKKQNQTNTTNTNTNNNTNTSSTCTTLYWKDLTNTTCQTPKQFCGSYMYYGLQTFSTQSSCLTNINQTNTNTSNTNNTTTTPLTTYTWSTSSYGTCSKSCGEGVQTRTVSCKRISDNVTVSDSFCTLSINTRKPVTQQLCNVQACGGNNAVSIINTNNTSNQVNTNIPNHNNTVIPGITNEERDPGYGLWIPRSNPNLYVVDRGLSGDNGMAQYIPWILNGAKGGMNDSGPEFDNHRDNVTGKIVAFDKPGKIISLRLRSINNINILQDMGTSIQLSDGVSGGSVGYTFTVSLSENPGDFPNTKCTQTSNTKPAIWFQGSSGCQLKANTNYYLNIRIDSGDIPQRAVYNADYLTTDKPKFSFVHAPGTNCSAADIQCPKIRFSIPKELLANNSAQSSTPVSSTPENYCLGKDVINITDGVVNKIHYIDRHGVFGNPGKVVESDYTIHLLQNKLNGNFLYGSKSPMQPNILGRSLFYIDNELNSTWSLETYKVGPAYTGRKYSYSVKVNVNWNADQSTFPDSYHLEKLSSDKKYLLITGRYFAKEYGGQLMLKKGERVSFSLTPGDFSNAQSVKGDQPMLPISFPYIFLLNKEPYFYINYESSSVTPLIKGGFLSDASIGHGITLEIEALTENEIKQGKKYSNGWVNGVEQFGYTPYIGNTSFWKPMGTESYISCVTDAINSGKTYLAGIPNMTTNTQTNNSTNSSQPNTNNVVTNPVDITTYGSCAFSGTKYLYYKNVGGACTMAQFACQNSKLTWWTQFSPAPTPPTNGVKLYGSSNDCTTGNSSMLTVSLGS